MRYQVQAPVQNNGGNQQNMIRIGVLIGGTFVTVLVVHNYILHSQLTDKTMAVTRLQTEQRVNAEWEGDVFRVLRMLGRLARQTLNVVMDYWP